MALLNILVAAFTWLMCARVCWSGCVEVESSTEAVLGQGFKLGCISCKQRREVEATSSVQWSFKSKDDADFNLIYQYEDYEQEIFDDRFENRLVWNGSKKTTDLLDVSVYILNVSFDDAGLYKCYVERTLYYEHYEFHTNVSKFVKLTVVPTVNRELTSIIGEVMMYVANIGLTFWLLVEMVYCYRKIAAAGEEALRENAAEYLAIASESKENCAGVQVAE
ncbi:sodium channel subunit beta-1-like [Huso huso]|uniref:Sodium channel regulatory subunit beta-1 n=1 Tax=Huso huso TaxID=61971 RepID=A0ABR0YB28_HUSHU